MGESGTTDNSSYVQAKDQKFSTTSLSISKGGTVRVMNVESRNFRHLFHSESGAFEDFNLNPRYSATLTFNEAGTYKIDLLNYYTGEPFGDTASVLTVTVA
jgi:plastocyanin